MKSSWQFTTGKCSLTWLFISILGYGSVKNKRRAIIRQGIDTVAFKVARLHQYHALGDFPPRLYFFIIFGLAINERFYN